MNKEQFISYLTHPDELHADTLEALEALVNDFPYFQSARILLILNLFNENSIRFDSELKTTAIYAGNRNILKKHINRLDKEKIKGEKEKEVQKPQPTGLESQSAEPPQPEKQPETEPVEIRVTAPTNSEEDTISKLKKIIEARIREIEEEKREKGENIEKKKLPKKTKLEIIDDFIAKEPTISRPKKEFYNPVVYAKQSIADQEEIVSETLAKIYFDQGYFEKAVNMYEKLILKYPKKSSYFAALIEKANNALNNQK